MLCGQKRVNLVLAILLMAASASVAQKPPEQPARNPGDGPAQQPGDKPGDKPNDLQQVPDPPGTEHIMRQLRTMFAAWDLDMDGKLDKWELARAFRNSDTAYDGTTHPKAKTARLTNAEQPGLTGSAKPHAAGDGASGLDQKTSPNVPAPAKATATDPARARIEHTKYPDYQFLIQVSKNGEYITREDFEAWARDYAVLFKDQLEVAQRAAESETQAQLVEQQMQQLQLAQLLQSSLQPGDAQARLADRGMQGILVPQVPFIPPVQVPPPVAVPGPRHPQFQQERLILEARIRTAREYLDAISRQREVNRQARQRLEDRARTVQQELARLREEARQLTVRRDIAPIERQRQLEAANRRIRENLLILNQVSRQLAMLPPQQLALSIQEQQMIEQQIRRDEESLRYLNQRR